MSKADDYYGVVNDVNKLLGEVFETESKQNSWYYYPCYRGLDGLIPATQMRKGLEEARKVYGALKKMNNDS